jgi:hypothetical protein
VYERGWLQRVVWIFLLQVVTGKATQFVIDERKQLLLGCGIASADAGKQARDF